MGKSDRSGDSERMLVDGRHVPETFSDADAEMAQTLNDFFDIAGEELPPSYVQTVLGDPLHAPADDGLEDRIATTVFARLGLERPTIPHPTPPRRPRKSLRDRARLLAQRVGRQAALAAMALAMLISYNAIGTGMALASMLQVMAGRGGARVVGTYPTQITTHAPTTRGARDVNVEFVPRWPGNTFDGYTCIGVDILPGQWWTRGAMVALRYEKQVGTDTQHLTMLQFVPAEQVQYALQVVQDGSMSNVTIGSAQGVFVWGQWVREAHQQMIWQPNQRAELIYGAPNTGDPVTWIAADDLSNMTSAQMQTTLVNVANAMQPMHYSHMRAPGSDLGIVSASLSMELTSPFANDVIALVPDHSNPDAPVVYVRIGPAVGDTAADG
jgi:hypothetical protein